MQKAGMVLAEEAYGVKDPQILHAIKVHTTGEPDMNTLDKIIYIADYIEPLRCEAPPSFDHKTDCLFGFESVYGRNLI